MRKPITFLAIASVLLLATDSAVLAKTVKAIGDWRVGVADGDHMIEEHRLRDAEECFKENLKAVKAEGGSPDDIALVETRLADTLQMRNIREESQPLYKKALHEIQRAHGKHSQLLVPDLYKIGQIFEADREPRHAAKIYRRTLKINEKADGPNSISVADNLYRLGRAYFVMPRTTRAQQLFWQVIGNVMTQEDLGSKFPLLSFLNDYVDLLRKNEHPEKILTSEFQNQLLKDPLGGNAPATAVAPSEWQKEVAARLAKAAPSQAPALPGQSGAPASANDSIPSASSSLVVPPATLPEGQSQDFFERMIAVDIKSLGPDNPVVGNDLIALSSLFIAQQRYIEARPLLERALKIYRLVYDDDNILVKRTQLSINEVTKQIAMQEHGTVGEAQLPGLPKIPLAAQNVEIARRLNELAFRLYAQGQVDDAVTVYKWALASTVASTGQRSDLVAGCCSDYARVLRSDGKVDGAVELEKVARSIFADRKFAINMPVP